MSYKWFTGSKKEGALLEFQIPKENGRSPGVILPQEDGTPVFVIACTEAYLRSSGREVPEVTVSYRPKGTQTAAEFLGGIIYVTPEVKALVMKAGEAGTVAELEIPLDKGVTDISWPFVMIILYRRILEAEDQRESFITKQITRLVRDHRLNILDVPGTETTARKLIRAILDRDEAAQDKIRFPHQSDPTAHRELNKIYWGMRQP